MLGAVPLGSYQLGQGFTTAIIGIPVGPIVIGLFGTVGSAIALVGSAGATVLLNGTAGSAIALVGSATRAVPLDGTVGADIAVVGSVQ